MSLALILNISFHDHRYHGKEWPPSPMRLFQAVVAGIALSGTPRAAEDTLQWWEELDAPVIRAPKAEQGSEVTHFVPQNAQDVVLRRGDPRKVLRYTKKMRPWIFNPEIPLLYVWRIREEDKNRAGEVCRLSECLYQLGHGVDMAWATGGILSEEELEAVIASYPGHVHKPSGRSGSEAVQCPRRGSFLSLEQRHKGPRRVSGDAVQVVRPPQPEFTLVTYDSPPVRRLFELRQGDALFAWPQEQAAALALQVRRAAGKRLLGALPARRGDIEQTLLMNEGRASGKGEPVRILPLPSIGHVHTPQGIRRVLVEVPGTCALSPEDVFWAVARSGLQGGAMLFPAGEGDRMLWHYGVGKTSRTWRTITPALLLEDAARRRIEPAQGRERTKTALQRSDEEMRAAVAVMRDLRVVQMFPQLESIRVQREPFEANGLRAEAYATSIGVAKSRLWHVVVSFCDAVEGPIVIGDGGEVGLGLMAPRRDP